jgi:hypothetical protein
MAFRAGRKAGRGWRRPSTIHPAGEIRLQALQARIDPRFLFDALAAVERIHDIDAAVGDRLLDNLIKYLRAVVPDLVATRSNSCRSTCCIGGRICGQHDHRPGCTHRSSSRLSPVRKLHRCACSREQRKPYPVSDYFVGDTSTGYPASCQAGKPPAK